MPFHVIKCSYCHLDFSESHQGMSETLAHMKMRHWKLVEEDYRVLHPGISADIFEGNNALTKVYNHYLANPRSEPVHVDTRNKRHRKESESKKRARPRISSVTTTQTTQIEASGSRSTGEAEEPEAPLTLPQLPPIKPAELYTSPIINVFIYDPTDSADDAPIEREDIPGVSKPFRLYRAALERASQFFPRYFKEQEENAAESSANTRTARVKGEVKVEAGEERSVAAQQNDTIHISKRYIPSAAAFEAFIEFAYSGKNYSCPVEEVDARAIFHAEVYVMAHSLQAELLQRIAFEKLYDVLIVSKARCQATARICELLYNIPGSPDGVDASYRFTTDLDGTLRDSAEIMIGLYVVTHKSQLKLIDGDNLKAIEEVVRKTPQLAVDIFRHSEKVDPKLFVEAQPKFA